MAVGQSHACRTRCARLGYAGVVLMSADPQDEGFTRKHKAKVIQHPAASGSDLICKADGSMVPCLQNAVAILESEPEWIGRLRLDEFAQVLLLDGHPIEDVDASEINLAIGRSHGGAQFKTPIIFEALAVSAHRHRIHPVREYLDGLHWDQTPRLDTWLADTFDCPQTDYARAIGANTLISAVARIMRPGCQVDTMLILEGNQGIGKSKALRTLFGIGWYTETTEKPGTKDFYQALRGKWCLELAELDSLRGADISRVKQVLSATSDNYRPSYGRFSRDFPRSNIFIGTTNEDHYLSDPSGARRFWPLLCRGVNQDYLARMRDQLWAEATHRYLAGDSWHIIPADDARAEQDARYDADVWEEPIRLWLITNPYEATMASIMGGCLGIERGRQGRGEQTRVGKILRRLGYVKIRAKTGERGYFYQKQ